jgi:hypothetical protein
MNDSKEAIRQYFDAVGYDDLILTCMGAEPARTESGGSEWVYRCFSHTDNDPSLRINKVTGLYHCLVCGESGDAFALWEQTRSCSFPEACRQIAEAFRLRCTSTAPAQHAGVTVSQLAEAKGFSAEELLELGVSDTSFMGSPAVRIPYLDERGEETTYSLRIALEGKDRFHAPAGSKRELYGLNWLPIARDQDRVILVEGETDCWTSWAHGLPAIGVPGATTWREDWAEQFDGISRIFVVKEPDQGGTALVEATERSFGNRLRVVKLPAKDTNEFYLQDREGFPGRFETALREADAGQLKKAPFLGLADLRSMSNVEWLLEEWIPKGALTLIVGETGVGKTWLVCYFIACATGILDWPDGTRSEAHKVCLLETESLRAEHGRRLVRLGLRDSDGLALPYPAELEGTEDRRWYSPSLPGDLEALVAPMISTGERWAVVVDSLSGAHELRENDAEMRRLLRPLSALAAKHDVPVIVAHHLKKPAEDGISTPLTLNRVRGSSTIVQFARSVIGLEQLSPNGPVRVTSLKSTFAKKPAPFGFQIIDNGEFRLCDPPVRPIPVTKRDRAAEFLSELLGDGPKTPAEVLQLAAREKLTESTLRRARDILGVISVHGKWSLPSRN